MCKMETVAVSSTMEAPALALDCAHGDAKNDDDDKEDERKGSAKNVTVKEVMLKPEQKRNMSREVRLVNINTEASLMSGEDNIMVFCFCFF